MNETNEKIISDIQENKEEKQEDNTEKQEVEAAEESVAKDESKPQE